MLNCGGNKVMEGIAITGYEIQNADQRSANPTFKLPWTHCQNALCLPDKELLQAKLKEWIAEYNEINGEK